MSDAILLTYFISIIFSGIALIPKTRTWMLWVMVGTLILAAPKEVRLWNHFHYYVNAKYFDELEFDQLYECLAVVRDAPFVRRNLQDYTWIQGAANCTANFSPDRWAAFEIDLQRWLMWDDVHRVTIDKGFNGTLPWLVAGKPLANALSPELVSLIDPALMVAAFGFAISRIGWRRAGFAALFILTFWGVFDRFWGNYLQYPWLAASIVAVVIMLKKPTSRLAGAFIGVAAALYIFPAFLLWGRKRRVWEGAIAAGLAMGLLGFSVGGIDDYIGMLHNMATHSSYIRSEPYNVGLANTLTGVANLDQWQNTDFKMSVGAGYDIPDAPSWWIAFVPAVLGTGWAGVMFAGITLSRYYYTILVCYLIEDQKALPWLFGINLIVLLALLVDEPSAVVLNGALLMTMFTFRARRPYIKRARAWIRDVGSPNFTWNHV